MNQMHIYTTMHKEKCSIWFRRLAEDDESNIQSIICTHALTMIDRAPVRTINHVIKNSDKSIVNFLAKANEDQDIIDFLNNVSQISGLKQY